MTSKRYRKILMSNGMQRDKAEAFTAMLASAKVPGSDYPEIAEDFMKMMDEESDGEADGCNLIWDRANNKFYVKPVKMEDA